MPDTAVRPFVREQEVPMADAITAAHYGPGVTARLIIKGVHYCQGRPEVCAGLCLVVVGGVLIDPDADPGADRPPTLGWIEAGNVREIVAALLTAATTPTRAEVTR